MVKELNTILLFQSYITSQMKTNYILKSIICSSDILNIDNYWWLNFKNINKIIYLKEKK